MAHNTPPDKRDIQPNGGTICRATTADKRTILMMTMDITGFRTNCLVRFSNNILKIREKSFAFKTILEPCRLGRDFNFFLSPALNAKTSLLFSSDHAF